MRIGRRLLCGLAAGWLLLSGAAWAEEVTGSGGAVNVNLSKGTVRLDDGRVLVVQPDTKIIDARAGGRVITLQEFHATEGSEEVPVRFRGQSSSTGIQLDLLELGVVVN